MGGDGSDAGDDEEAHGYTHLTANHESRQVASITFEKNITSFLGPGGLGTFLFGHLGNGKEGNLHTLKHTDNCLENEEKYDGNTRWNTIPHGGALVEEGPKGDGEGISEDGSRNKDTAPEEKVLESVSWSLVGFEGLSSSPSEEHLHNVAAVQKTRSFNETGDLQGEDGEAVVYVVKHTTGGVDLGRDLSNHGCHEEDGQTGT